jgi:CheY-like chemotaxis protein
LVTLSHELRTPLNAMLGWAQMLVRDDLDDNTRVRAVASIERNTKLQAKLIDDLLDLSRIISGKLKVDKHPIEVIPLVTACCDGFKKQAADKGIELSTKLSPVPDVISGDANRIQQIIGNLLANALKFTPRGGRIVVSVEETRRRRGGVCIRVRDTGKGIEAGLLPHIFERFRQGESAAQDPSGSKSVTGLGVGLGVARHLTELHGGTIGAESEGRGLGSIFTVELPLMDGEKNRSRRPSISTRPSFRLDVDVLAGLKILVVDDETDARELIATMLLQCGADVTQAPSVAEAFARLSTLDPDVLVSDIAMPGEDGYDLIRRVRGRGSDQEKRLPAIAVTAYATRQDRERAIEAGFDRHLAKPIEAGDLVGTVAHLAGRRQ